MDVRAAEVHAVAVSTHDMAAAGNLSGDDHLLFGVAASAARFLQLDIAVMRLAFLGAAVAAPPLVLAYPLAYLGLRGRHIRPWGKLAGADTRSLSGTAGLLAVELAAVLTARLLGWTLPDPIVVTVLACQAALALGWRRLHRTDRLGLAARRVEHALGAPRPARGQRRHAPRGARPRHDPRRRRHHRRPSGAVGAGGPAAAGASGRSSCSRSASA